MIRPTMIVAFTTLYSCRRGMGFLRSDITSFLQTSTLNRHVKIITLNPAVAIAPFRFVSFGEFSKDRGEPTR